MNQVLSINKAKTTEAIALILRLHQKPMILARLLKMMYFIDRLYLAQKHQSLTNDSYAITKSGLVPHQTQNLVEELLASGTLTISPIGDGYIALNHSSYLGSRLNEAETQIITHIYLQKRAINPFNFLDWNYDLEFLQQHAKKHGHTLVTPVHIMFNLGKSKAEILAYINTQRENRINLLDSTNIAEITAAAS